jgi:hypothetical protein
MKIFTTAMIRKLTIALGATAVLAAAALSPTAASAAPHGPHWGGHGHHGHHGWHGRYPGRFPGGWRGGYRVGFYGPALIAAPDCYVVRRVVYTPYGKRFRNVTVCD